MNKYFKNIADKLIDGNASEDVLRSQTMARKAQPVIWLLGKTGAGKTSLIRCLTGLSSAEIGNGFESCTRTTSEFEFPSENPLMRFLDTRGLDESNYDASQDIKECRDRSHVVLALARVDDPVQQSIAKALKAIRKHSQDTPVIIVHNAVDTIADPESRKRARHGNQQLFEDALGQPLMSVETAMPRDSVGPDAQGIEALMALLVDIMPEAALYLLQEEQRDLEKQAYQEMRAQVIVYASAAGSADLSPAIGAVAVPSIQAALLGVLGRHYGVTWTRRRLSEYSLALGVGAMLRFGGSYLSRQVAKFIPVYGQTVGAIAAGSISFSTTYALGRSCAYYLYQVQHGKHINQNEIRALYKTALKQAISAKSLAKSEQR